MSPAVADVPLVLCESIPSFPVEDDPKLLGSVLIRMSPEELEDLDYLRKQVPPRTKEQSRSSYLRECFRFRASFIRSIRIGYFGLHALHPFSQGEAGIRSIELRIRGGKERTS